MHSQASSLLALLQTLGDIFINYSVNNIRAIFINILEDNVETNVSGLTGTKFLNFQKDFQIQSKVKNIINYNKFRFF